MNPDSWPFFLFSGLSFLFPSKASFLFSCCPQRHFSVFSSVKTRKSFSEVKDIQGLYLASWNRGRKRQPEKYK
jgi:hypothetical protein